MFFLFVQVHILQLCPEGVWTSFKSIARSLFEGLGIKSIGYYCGGSFCHKVEQEVEG